MTDGPDVDVMETVGPELLAMLDQLGFGVAVGDERRRFVFVSRRWCEMVGTGDPQRASFVYPTPDGPRTYDVLVTPERSRPDGPVVRVWGVTRDVTDYVAGPVPDP